MELETEYNTSNECHTERPESGKDSEHQSNNRRSDNSNSNINRTEKKVDLMSHQIKTQNLWHCHMEEAL